MILQNGANGGTGRTDALDVKTLERSGFTEYYVTAAAAPRATPEGSMGRAFDEVAALVEEKRIQPIQEKVYGHAQAREMILEARRRSYAERKGTVVDCLTFIDGNSPTDAPFGGVQLWGVAPDDGDRELVSTVRGPDGRLGRRWVGDGFRMLYVPGVDGSVNGDEVCGCATEQATRMLTNAQSALSAHGGDFKHVVRTWIYLRRILDWYGEFNRVRTEFFDGVGITGKPGGAAFPASTGIQGHSNGEECTMDLLAASYDENGPMSVRFVTETSRQPAAFDYGSAFARATTVELENRRTVYVSGTASIDARGETIKQGDAEAQALETLLNIASLLEDEGGGLGDICMATVFCKTREVYEAYNKAIRLLGIPEFPTVRVLADVCRHDLLIEIEAVALI